MSNANTAIEWTNSTWSPVTGCTKVSAGCKHCYAERLFPRVYPGRKFTNVRFHPERLEQPLKWRKGRRIFVNSMSDLFHEDVTFAEITAVYAVMHASPQHTFQVLTKRPARRKEWAAWIAERGGLGPYIRSMTVSRMGDPEVRRLRRPFDAISRTEVHRGETRRSRKDPWMQVFNAAAIWSKGPLFNVWEGVSCEDQATADERIPLLLETPAAVRFVSAEPLLGPVQLDDGWCYGGCRCCHWTGYLETGTDAGTVQCRCCVPHLRDESYAQIDWVVVGGESGPHARPSHPQWFRDLRDQCQAAEVPFFLKQIGEWAPGEYVRDGRRYSMRQWFDGEWIETPGEWMDEQDHGPILYRIGKKAAGRELDGRTWDEYPA